MDYSEFIRVICKLLSQMQKLIFKGQSTIAGELNKRVNTDFQKRSATLATMLWA